MSVLSYYHHGYHRHLLTITPVKEFKHLETLQLSPKIYTYKMVVEAGSFHAETFFNHIPLHETLMPNGGVFRSLHSHGFGQSSIPGSELLDATRLAFATESTVEFR